MKKLLLLLLCVPLLFSCGEEKEKENYYLLKEICDCDIQAFQKIIKGEADYMRNYAKAYQNLTNMELNTEGDFSLEMDIIQQNTNIPLILIDESHDVLQFKNLPISDEILNNPKKQKEYILNEIEIMQQVGDSISIDVLGETQKLYYKNSDVNNKIIESIDLINKACEKIKTK